MTNLKCFFKNLQNEEEHKKALDTVNKRIISQDKNILFLSVVFKIVVFINILLTTFGTLFHYFDDEDLKIIESIPRAITYIADLICSGWNNLLNLVTKFELGESISVILTDVLLLIVIPLLVGLVCKIVVSLLKRKSPNYSDDLKEYYSNTYAFIQKSHKTNSSVNAKLPTYLALGIVEAFILFGVFTSQKSINFGMILGAIICVAIGYPLSTFPFRMIFSISKPIYKLHNYIFVTDIEDFEDAYASVDEEFKKEITEKRRKEEEAKRKREEQEKREREAQREREARKPKIRFNTVGISTANSLTVYIDDEKVTRFSGGQVKTVDVPEGYHKMQVQVYNDAAESAYWLDEVYEDFEPYKTYDIDYN